MTRRNALNLLLRCATVVAALCIANRECDAAGAKAATGGEPAVAPQSEVRSGGVLQDSYGYHRKVDANAAAKHPTIAPPGGWYGYGFPVKSYRWGWFGAEHYYPRVLWHHGYNGDHYRWSYRCGY